MTVRDKILERAPRVLGRTGKPTVDDFARAAGISRASFYRHFHSRDELMKALSVAPEPGARDRLLRAALAMVGEQGLTALSMDELAERAEVSRATLYRLFPGKPALFTALVYAYSPLEPVIDVLTNREHDPPDVVIPDVARAVYKAVYGSGENRTGIIRALFFEVSGLTADTEEVTRNVLARVVGTFVGYVAAQMSAGRLRRMHPVLALQAFIGPIFFHVMTRPALERVLRMEMNGEKAIVELAEMWLRAMEVEEKKR